MQKQQKFLKGIRDAQDASSNGYKTALGEIRHGQKRSHWIWYILPCLAPIRTTGRPQYSLPDLDTASAWLQDAVLGGRLREITEAATEQLRMGVTPITLFGSCDAKKFHETVTCFAVVAKEAGDATSANVFLRALEVLGGTLEDNTMAYVVGEAGLDCYKGIQNSDQLSALLKQQLPPQPRGAPTGNAAEDDVAVDGGSQSESETHGEAASPREATPATLMNSSGPERPTLAVEPRKRGTGLVVIFHGAGGSAYCFKEMAEEFSADLPHVKFLMPTAPERGPAGSKMATWMGRNAKSKMAMNYEKVWCEVLQSIDDERERRGVPLSRVVLMGYSAGAILASWVAMNFPGPCAGLVLLSGRCPTPDRLPEPRCGVGVEKTPVLYMCGTDDQQVPASCVREHVGNMRKRGFEVRFREFPGVGHEIIQEEFDEVKRFLVAVLPETRAEAEGPTLAADIRLVAGGAGALPAAHPGARSTPHFKRVAPSAAQLSRDSRPSSPVSSGQRPKHRPSSAAGTSGPRSASPRNTRSSAAVPPQRSGGYSNTTADAPRRTVRSVRGGTPPPARKSVRSGTPPRDQAGGRCSERPKSPAGLSTAVIA